MFRNVQRIQTYQYKKDEDANRNWIEDCRLHHICSLSVCGSVTVFLAPKTGKPLYRVPPVSDAKLTSFASEDKARNCDLPLMHRSDARPA